MNEDNLHAWIEPELEARITALVLGEASDFEREELERLINERPELGVYRKRMEMIHGMLNSNAEGETAPEGEWKLSSDRRATILEALGKPVSAESNQDSPASQSNEGEVSANQADADPANIVRPSFWSRLSPLAAAACLAVLLTVIVAISFPASSSYLNVASFKSDETDAYAAVTTESLASYGYGSKFAWRAGGSEVGDAKSMEGLDVALAPDSWSIATSNADTPTMTVATAAVDTGSSNKRLERDYLSRNSLSRENANWKDQSLGEIKIDGNDRTKDHVSPIELFVHTPAIEDVEELGLESRRGRSGQAPPQPERPNFAKSGHGGINGGIAVAAGEDTAQNRSRSGALAGGGGGGTVSGEEFGIEGREKNESLARHTFGNYRTSSAPGQVSDVAIANSGSVRASEAPVSGGRIMLGDEVTNSGQISLGTSVDASGSIESKNVALSSAPMKSSPGGSIHIVEDSIELAANELAQRVDGLQSIIPKEVAGGSISATREMVIEESMKGEADRVADLSDMVADNKPATNFSSFITAESADAPGKAGSTVASVEDKVPFTGDLPTVGRLFKTHIDADGAAPIERQLGRTAGEEMPQSDVLHGGVSLDVNFGDEPTPATAPVPAQQEAARRPAVVAAKPAPAPIQDNREAQQGGGRFHLEIGASDADMIVANEKAKAASIQPIMGPVPTNNSEDLAVINQSSTAQLDAFGYTSDPIASELSRGSTRHDTESVARKRPTLGKKIADNQREESKKSGLDAQFFDHDETTFTASTGGIRGIKLAAKSEELAKAGQELTRLSAALEPEQKMSSDKSRKLSESYYREAKATTRAKMNRDENGEWYSKIDPSVTNGQEVVTVTGLAELEESQSLDEQIVDVDGEMDLRAVTIAGVAIEHDFAELSEELDAKSSIDGISLRYMFEPVEASKEDQNVPRGGTVVENGHETFWAEVEVEKMREAEPGGESPVRTRVLLSDGTVAPSDAYGVDLAASPDIVEFDGFINYGAPIEWGREVRGFSNEEKRVEIPTSFEEIDASEENLSTFSLHVSDVSFKLAQAALAKGEWPDASRIRVEEFVNAFSYDDPKPTQEEKVACQIEQATHPFFQQRNLLRVSMSTAALGRAAGTPLRLTFLLDNSGSMERSDRQETVHRAFAQLADQLQPNDQVTLISFARQPRLLADQVSGDKAQQLVDTVSSLPSEGGTNLEAALQLAFEKAGEQQADGAQNRIILLTDGAANLGDAEPENLSQFVETMRDSGIAFDAAGIGADGLNDEILEALTRKGDGRYYLLDRPEDADEGFARQIAGALRPAAKNVKVQIEFNPDRIGKYKLLGFEKHRLEKEDFRDDSVDAAEMAAEEAGVAVYQVEAKPDGEGDLGFASVRFRDMSSGEMVEKRWPILYEANAARPDQAAPSMRIATAASQFAAHLKGDAAGAVVELEFLASLLADLPERHKGYERVQQLRTMIDQARQISGQ